MDKTNNNQLSEISKFILGNLKAGKNVSDEVLYEFISQVNNCIKTSQFQEIPVDFHDLSEFVMNKVSYGKLNEKPTDESLLMGKLWSAVSSVKIAEQNHDLGQSINDDAKTLESKYELLKTIRDNPGVAHDALALAHDALALATGMPAGELLQSIDNGKYFITREAFGRKCYYITKTGMDLLKVMEDNKAKSAPEKKSRFSLKSAIGKLFPAKHTPEKEPKLNSLDE